MTASPIYYLSIRKLKKFHYPKIELRNNVSVVKGQYTSVACAVTTNSDCCIISFDGAGVRLRNTKRSASGVRVGGLVQSFNSARRYA